MSLNLTKGLEVKGKYSNIDYLYGPYESLLQACLRVNKNVREKGLTVGILKNGEVTEYWWKSGIEDSNLVIKNNSIIEDKYLSEITGPGVYKITNGIFCLIGTDEHYETNGDEEYGWHLCFLFEDGIINTYKFYPDGNIFGEKFVTNEYNNILADDYVLYDNIDYITTPGIYKVLSKNTLLSEDDFYNKGFLIVEVISKQGGIHVLPISPDRKRTCYLRFIKGDKILERSINVGILSQNLNFEGVEWNDTAVTEQTVIEWGFTQNNGTVTAISVNGSTIDPDSNGIINLGNIEVILSNPTLSSNYLKSSLTNNLLCLEGGDTYETAFSKLEKAIIDNALVTAAALNDLNYRINNLKIYDSDGIVVNKTIPEQIYYGGSNSALLSYTNILQLESSNKMNTTASVINSYYYIAIPTKYNVNILTLNNENITDNFLLSWQFTDNNISYQTYVFHLNSGLPLDTDITITLLQ